MDKRPDDTRAETAVEIIALNKWFGEFRVRQGLAGALGGLLTVAVGAVSLEQFTGTLQFLFAPVVTIVSLMALTLIAEQTGLFRVLAFHIARRAGGDGRHRAYRHDLFWRGPQRKSHRYPGLRVGESRPNRFHASDGA